VKRISTASAGTHVPRPGRVSQPRGKSAIPAARRGETGCDDLTGPARHGSVVRVDASGRPFTSLAPAGYGPAGIDAAVLHLTFGFGGRPPAYPPIGHPRRTAQSTPNGIGDA
jgi:hypothetical protein